MRRRDGEERCGREVWWRGGMRRRGGEERCGGEMVRRGVEERW